MTTATAAIVAEEKPAVEEAKPANPAAPAVSAHKITCQLCGETTHHIERHLKDPAGPHAASGITIEMYQQQFPDAPIYSEVFSAKKKEAEVRTTSKRVVNFAAAAKEAHHNRKEPLHETFGLGPVKAAMTSSGDAIMISVMGDPTRVEDKAFVPAPDPGYIYDIALLKTMLMAVEMKIPGLLHGHAGTGKSSLWEQIAARTNRPQIRVQHDRFTEPFHIVGQMAANREGTHFEPGPLPLAMKYGFMYIADEYDFAIPGVTAVYQAVLEGKPLIIKDAPADSGWRVVAPHPNFYFGATGNTNGAGDESDLYAGTIIQNYANYSRFGVVEEVGYMPAKSEQVLLEVKVGLSPKDSERMINFANLIRDGFKNKDISAPIGPRELLFAAKIGFAKDSYKEGIKLAYANKLRPACKLKALEIVDRVFAK